MGILRSVIGIPGERVFNRNAIHGVVLDTNIPLTWDLVFDCLIAPRVGIDMEL